MKIALIADIHGNYKALVDVFEKIKLLADNIMCLGDITNGGDENDLCIEFLRNHHILCIYGGHDWACMKSHYPRIKQENMAFLESLPETIEIEGIFMVHDNPLEKARQGKGMWHYGSGIKEHFQASIVFQECPLFKDRPRIVVVSHTHKPAVFSSKEEIQVVPSKTIYLSKNESYILNPGAVGYTRKTNFATFGVLSTDPLEFTVYEVQTKDIFNIPTTQNH